MSDSNDEIDTKKKTKNKIIKTIEKQKLYKEENNLEDLKSEEKNEKNNMNKNKEDIESEAKNEKNNLNKKELESEKNNEKNTKKNNEDVESEEDKKSNSSDSSSNSNNNSNSNSNSESEESKSSSSSHNPSQEEYLQTENNRSAKYIEIKEKEMPISENTDKKFLKDKIDNDDNQKTEKIISDITKNLRDCDGLLKKEMEEIWKFKDFFEEKNFILTDLSCKRMAEIIHYIKSGNPVLLEGDTGTAKTRTSVIACEYLMKLKEEEKGKGKEDDKHKEHSNYIKFNLSADTKIDNLMNKYVGDNKSISGIKIESGAFYKSFQKGKILILDEINLASKEVLDCIGQALDSKLLSTELIGKELESCKMHKNFALIATQNPLKGSFINKRQNLGYAFFSRFQKVNCEKFSEEELFKIALGLAKKENVKIDESILKNIIDFHVKWEKESSLDSEDIFYFTIREIETVINALKTPKHKSIYSIIMNVYGARYSKKEKDKIKNLLNQYENLKEVNEEELKLPKNFPKCFKNNNLIQTVNSILFSLNNQRHVILIGEEGSGITQIARWCAKSFIDDGKEPFLCICSKKLQCEDLIGITLPNFSNNNLGGDTSETETNEILKFKKGFLVKAIKKGRCVIFDQINEAPSTVYERLNGLLDKKYNDEDNKFPVPECSEKTSFKIKKKFRIICTCNHKKIKQISPAFLSRFDIIYLENQLENVEQHDTLFKIIFEKLEEFEKKEKEKLREKPKSLMNDQIKIKQDKKKDQFDYSIKENLFGLINEKVKLIKNENNQENNYLSNYSISSIYKLCHSIYKLIIKCREKKRY